MQKWSIRQAKDHLSDLITAAGKAPQEITNRGKQAVVVLSHAEYERLLRQIEPLTDFFARSGFDTIGLERIHAAPREDEGTL